MNRRVLFLACTLTSLVVGGIVACGSDSDGGGASTTGPDASTTPTPPSTSTPPGTTPPGPQDAAVEAGKVIPDGLLEPIPYLSSDDNPFNGVVFASYRYFQDWEAKDAGSFGVDASSTTLSSSFGPTLIDSVDKDDGIIDGRCVKDGSSCEALFAGGTVSFAFDANVLGALPTHVGIAWTDGAPTCDAVFEAYDDADVLIGTKTASGVGDGNNTGSGGDASTNEDRYFGVVHMAGVKRIVVKSSSGGVEVDHLLYGR